MTLSQNKSVNKIAESLHVLVKSVQKVEIVYNKKCDILNLVLLIMNVLHMLENQTK